MTAELALRPTGGHLTSEQVDLVKRQICRPRDRDATDDELAMFIGQCERTGLDPFARQIYAVFRWDKQSRGEKMTVQVSIDGFRLVAERTGKYAGQDGPFWCDKGGVWSDTWIAAEPPTAAKVIVRKVIGGVIAETSAVAHFEEYAVTNKDGSLSSFWKSKPALMIGKCAEALALRKAFPQELSGLYTAEEMAQADVITGEVVESAKLAIRNPDEPATDRQKKRINQLLKSTGTKAEDARALYTQMTGEPYPMEKRFADALSKGQASDVIDRLVQGALPSVAYPSDVPVPGEGEFVHPPVEKDIVELIKDGFEATEEPAA